MAYEYINASSLKNSLMSCKNSLNHSISEKLISDIINPSIWLCDSKKVLQDNLYKLNNIYKELESDINKFLEITGKIEQYKILQQEVNELQKAYNDLSPQLYFYMEYDEQTMVDGQLVTVRKGVTSKNIDIENQMNNIINTINEKKNAMETLKNNINNSF